MHKIISIEKTIRATCSFSETLRFKNTVCDIEVGGRHSRSMLVTEIHVNRGFPSDERVLSLKCDIENATFDAGLGESFHCSIHTFTEIQNIININVISWSKDVRLVVESADERTGKPCQGTLIIDDIQFGPVTAYEPLNSSIRREIIISDSGADLDGFIFSSIQAGKICYFDPYPNHAISSAG